MEQTRALNALEPFLALSKSANSPRAAADLITQATSAPNTYVFAELLQTPNIQALRESADYSKYLTLLEIYSWGTWSDYISNSSLPDLSPAQQKKLRLLSLLPLSSSHSTLTYTYLKESLALSTTRELEDLVITAIYADLLTATLDPSHGIVAVTSVAPLRDLAPGSIPTLQLSLSTWSQRCSEALADLDKQILDVKTKAKERERKKKQAEKSVEDALKSTEEKAGKRGAGYLNTDDDAYMDAMDLDQEQGTASGRLGLRSAKKMAGFGTRRFG